MDAGSGSAAKGWATDQEVAGSGPLVNIFLSPSHSLHHALALNQVAKLQLFYNFLHIAHCNHSCTYMTTLLDWVSHTIHKWTYGETLSIQFRYDVRVFDWLQCAMSNQG